MNILSSKCSIHVLLKRPKEDRKSKFPKKRRVKEPNIVKSFYMRLKLSHNSSIFKNYVAASKIRVDPKHFFMHAKRYSIFNQEVSPLFNPLNNTSIENIYDITVCSPSLKQTSVIKDTASFFLSHVTTTREDDIYLTDITLYDSIIIEEIKELFLTQQVVHVVFLLLSD